ncbi:fibronectin type III domain-containing protein [Flavobacterium sp. XGLA_31]|uniref:fibronectin type III domain-containing protein n=1 Tax=Flavobacterium sp. XGLA_31 TaxID=3447666 RepID=UPI003F2EAF46
MKTRFCRLEFHNFGTSKLDTFSSEVKNGIYNNAAVFENPTVTEADFTQALTDFNTAAADYAQFGITKKTAFETKRQKLMQFLDSLANYVDSIAQGDISVIALAGFTPSSISSEQAPVLDKIQYFLLKRTEVAGEIIVDIQAIPKKGTIAYGCICVEGAPLSNPVFVNGQLKLSADDPAVLQDANKTRRKMFSGLTPGVVYYFYVYATNSASVSPLSDAKSILAA